MSENQTGVTVTLKAGTGFEAPWIVIHASDTSDALSQIDTGDFAKLAERTVAAAEFFRAAHNVKTGLPAGGGQQAPAQQQQSWSNQGSGANASALSGTGYGAPSQQQQAPAAPDGAGKMCAHGPMTFREGVSKTSGKPYRAYFCSSRDRATQCKPEFLRD